MKQQQLNQLKVPIDTNEDPKCIEKSPSEWKFFLLSLEIILALCDRNACHFGQAHRTPFTFNPLPEIFESTTFSKYFLDENPITLIFNFYLITTMQTSAWICSLSFGINTL